MTSLPEPQRHIGNLIRRAQQTHAAMWAREVSERITSIQYGVLAILERMPGASQKEIGEEASVDRSSLAELVQRMQRAGLIERVRDDSDRRRNVLALTPAGREELHRLQPRVDELQRLLVAELSAADEVELRRLLALVLSAEDPRTR
ncbi:MAG TPA: MarR family winged helix-turn-helix transcriptional regulator [Microbacteriaceae bacterium]|nr:MarR family winged helix-turn-helix transcriptional regulator [Microbacteriaceae bacterium]